MKVLENMETWVSRNANPVLVKELRQGLRTKMFLGAFLLVQGAMVFMMLIAIAARVEQDNSAGAELFFYWLIILFPLLLLIPLQGAGTISREIKENLLELVFLTRMNALRTVFGKWLALFAQSVLLIIAVLPYMVMRYFLGGVDLLAELGLLLIACLASALLIALQIAQSALKGGLILGVLLMVGLVVGTSFLMNVVLPDLSLTRQGWWFVAGLICAVLTVFLVVRLLLEVAAGVIAPMAENHSIYKRILGLILLATTTATTYALFEEALPGLVIGGGILFFVLAESFCEPVFYVHGMHANEKSPPGLRTIRRLFFLPGWVSGVNFALLTAVLGMVLLAWLRADVEYHVIFMVVFGSCILPAAVVRLFSAEARLGLPMYILIQLICFLLGMALYLLQEVLDVSLQQFALFIPSSYAAILIFESQLGSWSPEMVFAGLFGTNIVLLLILLIRGIMLNRRVESARALTFARA
jgi:hypothetical protein